MAEDARSTVTLEITIARSLHQRIVRIAGERFLTPEQLASFYVETGAISDRQPPTLTEAARMGAELGRSVPSTIWELLRAAWRRDRATPP